MSGTYQSEIAKTEAKSAALSRELRLGDLVFLQVLLIVGLPWIGYAARQGGTQIVLWLLAVPLFYLPIAGAVIYLSRRMPLEGGVYQWVKIGLSPAAGFQAGWNYAFLLILFYANSGSVVTSSLVYLLGPSYEWMNASKPLLIGLNIAFFALVLLVNIRGLHLARWITSAGGALVMALYLLVVALLALRLFRHEHLVQPIATFAWPGFSLLTVNLFTKLAFNALSGFEQVAIFAGECRTPERNIARSVWIAGPAIAILYILATCGMLAYVPAAKADLIAPVSQVVGIALHGSATATALGSIAILGLLFAYFTQTVACIAQVSRLPMVAGWDGLFSARFTHLHPKFKTPVRSLLAVVAISLLFGAASLIQVGQQEANQILIAAAMACSGLYYLMIFAVILWGRWDTDTRGNNRAPIWLRISVCAAAGVTALAVALNVVPVLEVTQPWRFGAQVAGVVVIVNVTGACLYRRLSN